MMTSLTDIGVLFAAISLAGLGCLSGCGNGVKTPPTSAVTGTVRFQGKPLEGAEISFMTTGASRAASGITNEKGEFTLSTFGQKDGAIPGEHRVTVRLSQLPDFQKKSYPDSKAFETARREAESEGQSVKSVSLIPERYSIADKSGLNAHVEAGKKNAFVFELTD